MDGHNRVRRRVEWCVIATALSLASATFAQAPCDSGNPCAQSDVASHAAVGPSTGAGNPIDLVSGNKYRAETDFRVPGELGLSFTRHYNSTSAQGGAFGGGWSHSYETVLLRVERADVATITIAQADGRRIVFRPDAAHDGKQRYRSVPIGYGIVEEDSTVLNLLRREEQAPASLRPWRWRWFDGRQLWFDGRGALRRIEAANGEWIELDYDEHTRLIRISDFAGRALQLAYWDHPADALATFGDASRALRGARYRLKSLALPDRRVIEYGYDAHGQLARVRFPDGSQRGYEYANEGGGLRLARVFNRLGELEADYRYAANGDAERSAPGDGATIEVQRTPNDTGGVSWLTDATGAKTSYRWRIANGHYQLLEARGPGCTACPASNVRYRYDEHGLVERIEKLSPVSGHVEWAEILTRDAIGRIVERHRERGGSRELIERYRYLDADPLARPTRIERPSVAPGELHVFELTYNERGQPLELIESGFAPTDGGAGYTPIARRTTYAYYEAGDGAPHLIGRLKWVDGPLPSDIDRVHFRYDARGLLSQIRYSTGAAETFEYDAIGRIARYVPLDGVPVDVEHDSEGHLARLTRAGIALALRYDSEGRINELHDPIGQRFVFKYDAAHLRAISDSEGNRIEFDAGPDGRPIPRRLLNPDGTVSQENLNAPVSTTSVVAQPFSPAVLSVIRLPVLQTWKTAASALIASVSADQTPRAHETVLDERGLASHYRYDDFGRLIYAYNPDAGLLSLAYDEASRVIERRFGDGRSMRYTYDALSRVTHIEADDERVSIEYGAFNKPARIGYSWGEELFEYDHAARVVRREQRIDGLRFVRAYRYDDLGRLTETTLSGGATLVYRYNGPLHAKPGVLSAIERKHLFGSTPIVSGLNDADDRFDRSNARFGNGLELSRELDRYGRLRRYGTPGVALFEIDTDPFGRIAAAHDHRTRRFTYDHAGRLQHASLNGIDTAAFAYDESGNARIVSHNDTSTLLRIDAASNRVLARTEPNGRQLRYAYDDAGRTIAIGDRTFDYDGFGRLARIADDGRLVAEYTYNTFGERIRKVVYSGDTRSVTYFFYDGAKLVAEANAQGQITKQFVYLRDRPVAMLQGSATYALHTDWRGTPVAATDDDRRVVWRAELDAVGHVRSTRGAITLPLRGSNQYFDVESGLHYNIHRYFDPATARYLTPDPIGQHGGLNLYAFAQDDSINFIDPLGWQAIPADYDFVDRYAVFLKAGIRALPAELADSVGEALREMLEPGALATAAAIFAAWGVSQLTPFGWAADLVIIGIGAVFMGKAIVDLAQASIAAYRAIRDAQTMQDLCDAGRTFARAISDVVLELGGGGGIGAAARRIGPQVAAQIRRAFGRSSRPPPPGPLLWTQEMPQRVTDGYGNQIRQFMAGLNHLWDPKSRTFRWQALEAGAIEFAKNYFGAKYVINAKHMNGNLDHPNPVHGFDIVYIKEDGTLVIGEAKSGRRATKLTAFGGGDGGKDTLDLNLWVVKQRVEHDPTIPEHIKEKIFDQIENRTFETHLYVPPTTTIPSGYLDVFPELLGRPLDAIYILPELR